MKRGVNMTNLTIEEKLKAYILINYKSLRDFVNNSGVGLSYTTIDGMLKRGLGRSSIHNVIKVCNALHISTDALAEGSIVEVKDDDIAPIDLKKFAKNITVANLELDGKPLSKYERRLVAMGLNMAVEMIRDNRQ